MKLLKRLFNFLSGSKEDEVMREEKSKLRELIENYSYQTSFDGREKIIMKVGEKLKELSDKGINIVAEELWYRQEYVNVDVERRLYRR